RMGLAFERVERRAAASLDDVDDAPPVRHALPDRVGSVVDVFVAAEDHVDPVSLEEGREDQTGDSVGTAGAVGRLVKIDEFPSRVGGAAGSNEPRVIGG